jgi:hypothetical protein
MPVFKWSPYFEGSSFLKYGNTYEYSELAWLGTIISQKDL